MSDNTAIKIEPEHTQEKLSKISDNPEDMKALIEKDLQALVQNPRCPDGLRAAIWKELSDLRNN